MAASVGSTSTAINPAFRTASSCRCDALATRTVTSLLSTRTRSQSMGPSGRIKTPAAPNRRAASHASEKHGGGAVALVTTLGVTAGGLDQVGGAGRGGATTGPSEGGSPRNPATCGKSHGTTPSSG